MFATVKEVLLYVALFGGLYFQVFLLVSYFLWDGKTEFGEDDVPSGEFYEPSVAIMVPCYNEGKTVVGTVNSLLAMDYPREKLRIVVIDDGSKDDTWQVVQQFANHPSVVLLQKQNEGSKFAALNYGLKHIRTQMDSEIIGCLDADSAVHPSALRESILEFTKPGVMAVVPSMVIDQPKSFFQWMQKVEYELATYAKQAFSRLNTLYIAPGPFTLFNGRVFDELGEYREAHHTEDMEIAIRMQMRGMRLSHAIDSLVYTKGPKTWGALLKQRIRWTYGFIMNVWDYKGELFFKDSMGHLGMTIPILFAMLVISVLVIPIMFVTLILPIVHLLQRFSVTHDLFTGIKLDAFYVSMSAYSIIGFITLAMLFATIFIGRKKLLKQNLLSVDLATIFVYPFFAAWWTLRSALNAIMRKKSAWR